MKNFFLILQMLSLFAYADDSKLTSSLFDNLCYIENSARSENAPRTRSSTRVLPNRPPPNLEESPLQFIRARVAKPNGDKNLQKRRSEFTERFWKSLDKQVGEKSQVQKVLSQLAQLNLSEVKSKCELTVEEKKQLLLELTHQ